MIISTLRVPSLPRFRGALTGLKNTSRCICNTTRMAKPDHSERTAAEPRDPVRNGAARYYHLEHLLTKWSHSTVAQHGHSQAHRGGQPLNPHLQPRHPAGRGEHQGKSACIISDQVSMEPCIFQAGPCIRLIQPLPRVLSTELLVPANTPTPRRPVPPRPVARCLRAGDTQARRFHHHLVALKSPSKASVARRRRPG